MFLGKVRRKIKRPQPKVSDDCFRLDMLKARAGRRAQPLLVCNGSLGLVSWPPWADSNSLTYNASTHVHLQLSDTHKQMHVGKCFISSPFPTYIHSTCRRPPVLQQLPISATIISMPSFLWLQKHDFLSPESGCQY